MVKLMKCLFKKQPNVCTSAGYGLCLIQYIIYMLNTYSVQSFVKI